MKNRMPSTAGIAGCVLLVSLGSVCAQDWPQWRGPNRDDKAMGFNAPKSWPRELTQKWKVTVGRGDAQKGDVFCLDAPTGKSLWTAPLGGRDFGSVIDAGSVLLAVTPQGDLTAFEPSDKEFKKLASYKVATTPTYAHPIAVGNRICVKDQDSITLWAVD